MRHPKVQHRRDPTFNLNYAGCRRRIEREHLDRSRVCFAKDPVLIVMPKPNAEIIGVLLGNNMPQQIREPEGLPYRPSPA
jgi:hypothetical protein